MPNSETPKPPDGYKTWFDLAVSFIPPGIVPAIEINARAELAALRAEVERLREQNVQLGWMLRDLDDEKCDCDNTMPRGSVCGWRKSTCLGAYRKHMAQARDAALEEACRKISDMLKYVGKKKSATIFECIAAIRALKGIGDGQA